MLIIGVLFRNDSKVGVQSLIVAPDEINKESKHQEQYPIYESCMLGLDKVKVDSFAAQNNLTAADIASNKPTISNIRINDYEPVKRLLQSNTQSIRHTTISRCDRYI